MSTVEINRAPVEAVRVPAAGAGSVKPSERSVQSSRSGGCADRTPIICLPADGMCPAERLTQFTGPHWRPLLTVITAGGHVRWRI